LQLFAGGNYNLQSSKPTQIFGVAFHADPKVNGLNPAVMAVHRAKSSCKYTLAIFTLFGRTMNKFVIAGIDEAMFEGSLKRSRIIGGKYMGEPGLGNAYEMQDFGLVSIAYSSLRIEAGPGATLIQNDLTGYLTYPYVNRLGVSPYLGFTWTEFSDLIFNPANYQLDDPRQDYWEIKVGGKFPIRHGEIHQPMYHIGIPQAIPLVNMRLNAAFDNHGGVKFKSSFWF